MSTDEQIYADVFDEEIILTAQVRTVILTKHPEVADFSHEIEKALREPDEIRRSIRDERVVLYYRHVAEVLNGKWVVVVVKRLEQNFVSTIYATDQIKSGEVIWTK
ncbi:MAG: hypothetical protein K8J31_23955 [Anaerolineae bacterium]|nr:hypothetical protein [Anaerolineae bacterium]